MKKNNGTWYVTVFETQDVFGGYEEGGWWYTEGTAIKHIRVRGYEKAIKIAESITDKTPRKIVNGVFGYENNSPYRDCDDDGTTLYDSKIVAMVSRKKITGFPEQIPFYE